jgi:hypothetical protein
MFDDKELRQRFGLITTSSVIEVETLIIMNVACPKCGAAAGSLCYSKRGRPVAIHNSRAELARTLEGKRLWWSQYLAWQARLIAYNNARDARDGMI